MISRDLGDVPVVANYRPDHARSQIRHFPAANRDKINAGQLSDQALDRPPPLLTGLKTNDTACTSRFPSGIESDRGDDMVDDMNTVRRETSVDKPVPYELF
jgi:hypothetical protein